MQNECKNQIKIQMQMKKMMMAVLFGMMVSMTACAENAQLVTFGELPKAAQTFIETYFHASDILFIKAERDGLHQDYDVRMSDGTEIDFDYQGNLEEVDCQLKAVPDGIVPERIATYVSQHFANALIVKYKIDRREQKVELNNSLELEFDRQGNFLRIDD